MDNPLIVCESCVENHRRLDDLKRNVANLKLALFLVLVLIFLVPITMFFR